MKRIAIITSVFLFLTASVAQAQDPQHGQRRVTSNVTVTHSALLKKIKDADAILFSFSGDANFTKKFIDLSKKLQKKYRDTYEIGFEYNMESNNKAVKVLANYPKRAYKKVDHDLIYKIRAYDYEMQRLSIYINEKINYKVDVEIFDSKTSQKVGVIQLDVESINTLFANNKGIVDILDTTLSNKIASK